MATYERKQCMTSNIVTIYNIIYNFTRKIMYVCVRSSNVQLQGKKAPKKKKPSHDIKNIAYP